MAEEKEGNDFPNNIQIYNLSSSLNITHFSAIVAKKWYKFEQIFVSKRANSAHRQQMTTVKI